MRWGREGQFDIDWDVVLGCCPIFPWAAIFYQGLQFLRDKGEIDYALLCTSPPCGLPRWGYEGQSVPLGFYL